MPNATKLVSTLPCPPVVLKLRQTQPAEGGGQRGVIAGRQLLKQLFARPQAPAYLPAAEPMPAITSAITSATPAITPAATVATTPCQRRPDLTRPWYSRPWTRCIAGSQPASADITGEYGFIIVGSQSILGPVPDLQAVFRISPTSKPEHFSVSAARPFYF